MTASVPPTDNGWKVEQIVFDPETVARDAALFALSNGHIGVRGGIEELAHMHASFLPAAYVQRPIRYHESFPGFAETTDTRLTGPGLTAINISVDGTAVDFTDAEMLAFRRTLDLATGALERITTWLLPDGREIEISAVRIVPAGMGSTCLTRISVRPVNFSGMIEVECPVALHDQAAGFDADDPRISARAHLAQLSRRDLNDVSEWVFTPASGGKPRVTIVQRLSGATTHDRIAASLQPGQPLCFDRIVAASVAAGGDGLVDSKAHSLAENAAACGFDLLLTKTADELQGFWTHSEIRIENDTALQQALRFNLFHIFQSASRDADQGIAAKGLTGEGYEGHYFWDTEAFVLPVLALSRPSLARELIEYRIGHLDQARQHARRIGHNSGALYPWRTIGGQECSAHYPTGSAQYHVNAAIAYALEIYFSATGDRAIFGEGGAEMLFETARLWIDTGYFCERRGGAFVINGVTGPDEYSALVDNDFYTNAMARRHLRFAAKMARELKGAESEEWALWERAAAHMWLPVDPATGVHPQDDAFMDKPPFAGALRSDDGLPLLVKYHPMVLFRHRLCKQGDVIQAHAIGATTASQTQIGRDLTYYEPLTTHDSTLSTTAFAIAAARSGEARMAMRFMREAAFVDLHDLHANTSHGCHMAAMAGSWLTLAMGWGGLTVAEGELSLAPICPDGWESYSFRFHWRGATVEAYVRPAKTDYRLICGNAAHFLDHGRPVDLSAGTQSMLPLPFDAVIFDLDGVITDTAEAHYRAWKRLCDEEGLAFDRAVNDKLKGIERALSLQIIAEHAGIIIPQATFDAMLVRKNDYYRQSLSEFGPGDLFPQVDRLLAELRDARLKIGLASASRNARDLIRRLGIESCFDHIADAAQIVRGKPHPDIFLETAAAMDVLPERCIGIEDSNAGISAIRSAGMLAIGIGDSAQLPEADVHFEKTGQIRLGDLGSPFTAKYQQRLNTKF